MGVGRREGGGAFTYLDVAIDIPEADADIVLISIDTPLGLCEMLAQVTIEGATLYLDKVHVGGMVDADVERLVIQGATRTTGRFVGRRPSPVIYPR